MSGDRFKIQDQQGLYFITPIVVQWIDACLSGRQVFTRLEYRDGKYRSIVDALETHFSFILVTNEDDGGL